MKADRDQTGFTLIEILVTLMLFSIVSVGFYSVLFSTRDGTVTVRDVSTISQEARLGFNRMIRDTREASSLLTATPTSYKVRVDFDGDLDFDGAFEEVTYAYDAVGGRITISDGVITETLMDGVTPLAGRDVFGYGSNLLEHDTDQNGTTSIAELDAARAAGASLLGDNLLYITNVTYAFEVEAGDSSTTFFTQAQLRNFRGAG